MNKRNFLKGFFWTFLQNNDKQLVRDPVCGMWINPEDAACEIIYEGKIFYFCAPGCIKDFQEDPRKYLQNLTVGKSEEYS